MSGKAISPTLGSKSFTCPHCGAIAHQSWYQAYLDDYSRDNGPWHPEQQVIERIEKDEVIEDKQEFIDYFKRKIARELFRKPHKQTNYLNTELVNLHISLCYSCDRYGIWIADRMIYPSQLDKIQPNEEMPDEIRADFLEAASIVDQSPRGAAALLRLCIQELMLHLGLEAKDIDKNIGVLVKRGLDGRVQKALDVVRVIGNHAVHPGQIDLRDDRATATELFGLVNLIVEAMIATPKHVEAMFNSLPEGARLAIEKRDGVKHEASGTE